MSSPSEIISASEVGQWVYCQRAWFLARAGKENANTQALARGESYHRRHSRGVMFSRILLKAGVVLMILGALILLLLFYAFR